MKFVSAVPFGPLAPIACTFALSLFGALPASAAKSTRIPEVVVSHSHVSYGDLVPTAAPEIADVDLGPAPQLGGTRMIDHNEIAFALSQRQIEVPTTLPAMVRITRHAESLAFNAVDKLVRESLDSKLTKGVSLTAIHLTRPLEIPSGYTRVTADLPRPGRKAGPVTSATTLTFFEGDQPIAMASVVVDLLLSAEATVADVTRGSHITLVMRRGFVEVSTQGQANIDGDVGDVIPVLLRPAGRVIRARIEDRDHAIALDDT